LRISLHETIKFCALSHGIDRRISLNFLGIRNIKNSLCVFLAEEETTTVTLSEITDSEQTKTQSNGDTGE